MDKEIAVHIANQKGEVTATQQQQCICSKFCPLGQNDMTTGIITLTYNKCPATQPAKTFCIQRMQSDTIKHSYPLDKHNSAAQRLSYMNNNIVIFCLTIYIVLL